MLGHRPGVGMSHMAGPGAFGAEVSVAGGDAIVTVKGEVDPAAAVALDTALDALIDGGPRRLVVDLTQLQFSDAAARQMVVAAFRRLRDVTAGGSRPSTTMSALQIMGLAEVVPLERAEAPPRPEPPRPAPSPRLAPGMARTAEHQAGQEMLQAALDLVVVLARATVAGADGVSVSLPGDGGLITVAASDEIVGAMDADQYVTGEGPCVTAAAEGRRVQVESVDEETRWPAFTPRARQRGINAILSNPLQVGSRPMGALNIYSRTPRAFGRDGEELATLFAEQASIVLTHAGAGAAQEQGGPLSDALRMREVIAQAQGALMERDGLAADEVFANLLHASRRTSTPMRRIAQTIVTSTQHAPPTNEDPG